MHVCKIVCCCNFSIIEPLLEAILAHFWPFWTPAWGPKLHKTNSTTCPLIGCLFDQFWCRFGGPFWGQTLFKKWARHGAKFGTSLLRISPKDPKRKSAENGSDPGQGSQGGLGGSWRELGQCPSLPATSPYPPKPIPAKAL